MEKTCGSATSQFSFILLHNLSLDSLAAGTVSTFSQGSLHSLQPIEEAELRYEISSEHKEVCGDSSGLTFGPVNRTNDRSFIANAKAGAVQTHISIGGRPFFASIQRERAEVFFLVGANVAGLSADVAGKPLAEQAALSNVSIRVPSTGS